MSERKSSLSAGSRISCSGSAVLDFAAPSNCSRRRTEARQHPGRGCTREQANHRESLRASIVRGATSGALRLLFDLRNIGRLHVAATRAEQALSPAAQIRPLTVAVVRGLHHFTTTSSFSTIAGIETSLTLPGRHHTILVCESHFCESGRCRATRLLLGGWSACWSTPVPPRSRRWTA
jgi:hypothetical protein